MKVLYTGSFNPWHLGHQYVFDRLCKYFSKENVYIGIDINPTKPSSNHDLIKWSLVPVTKNVTAYSGLTSDTCKTLGIELIARGIRPGKSIEYEEDLMYWNLKLGGIETILIPTPPELNQISSSVIRELKNYPSVNLEEFVNTDVYYRWLSGKKKIIYFGRSCSGKSTYLKKHYGDQFLECDKVIWDYISDRAQYMIDELKTNMIFSIREKNIQSYDKNSHLIGGTTNWQCLFDEEYKAFDAPVIGNYWKFIPKHILGGCFLVKISTSDENRKKFCEAKKWPIEFLDNLDYFYKDPPYWDEEIIIR